MMPTTITIERFAYNPIWPNDLSSTLGVMYLPSGRELATIERPWLNNQPRVSCIPEGVYTLSKRQSPVVKRSSRGKYDEGWEVRSVPNRSYIMIHPGNWSSDIEGCIAVGMQHGILHGKIAVEESQRAFELFMTELSTYDSPTHELHIRPFLASYHEVRP